MRASATVFLAALLTISCAAADSGAPADGAPEAPGAGDAGQADVAPPQLGGCILMEPIGAVPNDVYTLTDVVATDEYPPFTKMLDAYGLLLVAQDGASDDFMRLVGRTIAEIFPQDETLDLPMQAEILRNHYRYKTVIPVPINDDRGYRDDEAFERTAAHTTICDIIMQDVPRGQVMEVVEHILHYVSDVGLHYTFPDEWGINETSALALGMQKAIDEGYYNIEQYSDVGDARGQQVRRRVVMQEFAYWIISTAWNLQEPYGPGGEDEWTISNADELREKLPDLYAAYERTVGRTMVPPSAATLREIGPTRAEERQ